MSFFVSEFSEFLKKQVKYQTILLLYMIIYNVIENIFPEHKNHHFIPKITLEKHGFTPKFPFFKYIFNIY